LQDAYLWEMENLNAHWMALRADSARAKRLGVLSRPSYGFEHIDEGSSAVRAPAFECSKFSLKSPKAGRPLKFGKRFSCINDGRTHGGANRRFHLCTAIECSDFDEFRDDRILTIF
jgi:hypothetical protein